MVMPKLERAKTPVQKSALESPAPPTSKGGPKTQLKAATFDEGSSLLAPPVQMKPGGKVEGTKPSHGHKASGHKSHGHKSHGHKSHHASKGGAKADGGLNIPAPPTDVVPPPGPGNDQAAPEQAAPGPAKAAPASQIDPDDQADQERKDALAKWCVDGVDDPDQVVYCVKHSAGPDKLADAQSKAKLRIRTLKKDPAYARYSGLLSDKEMIAIAMYSTNAAYPMNAVLRGTLKSDPWVKAYGPIAAETTAALAKMPTGARNEQGTKTKDRTGWLDPKKDADKIFPIGTLYRNDEWSSFFDPVFAGFAVGRSYEEPGFFSATMAQGSYKPNAPVRRTLEGCKVARSIADLSLVASEKEALMPPGQRFQITSIKVEDTKTGKTKHVDDPLKKHPDGDKGQNAFNRPGLIWHVKLKHVAVATGKKDDAAGKKKGDDKADDKKGAAKDNDKQKASFLDRLLGIAHADA